VWVLFVRKRGALVLLLCGLLLPVLFICSPRAKATEPALVRVVNPATGDGWFNFTTHDKKVGDTFLVNITVDNVTNLTGWQLALSWNTSLLEYVNVDSLLFCPEIDWEPPFPLVYLADGTLYTGMNAGPRQPSFSGSTVMVRIELKVLGIGQSDLTLENDTYLFDDHGSIPFTPLNASFHRYVLYADVNNDGTVNMKDIADAVAAFNTFPGKSNWNPYADLNNDGIVNTRDIVIIILNLNKHL
jgi:hypothetical protein